MTPLVAIGCSLGGMAALRQVLAALPSDFAGAVVVAQHRHAVDPGGEGLLRVMGSATKLEVSEAEDKEPIEKGRVYFAPADYHLLVEDGHFALSTEGRVTFSRPSIDVLFESIARSSGQEAVGVVLTGNSSDGSEGLASIERSGGYAIVQDPQGAAAPAMPQAALARTRRAEVLPLEDIGPRLATIVETPA